MLKFLLQLLLIPLFSISVAVHASSQEVALEQPFYVNITELFPSQHRYASMNVQEKMNRKLEKGDAWWDQKEERWVFLHNEGTSIFSIKEALPVAKTCFGYALLDGHHDVLASKAFRADWIPIRVFADCSALSESDFWAKAEALGFAYLYDLKGEGGIPPKEFEQLEDDSNRFFAAISARKYTPDLTSSAGADYPIWIKIGKDIPFIEFKISDALWKSGFEYSYEMGLSPSMEVYEAAREIIKNANIEGLKVVPERLHYSEVQL
ncbi:MAG: ParB-like protein [Chlamydiales bacterium]